MSDFSGESRKAEYKYSQEAEVRAEATLYVMGHTMLNKTHRWPRAWTKRERVCKAGECDEILLLRSR